MQHKLMNVEAKWPKIDRPYVFNPSIGERGGSEPTEATNPDGSYEIHVLISEEQAKELAKLMAKTYKEDAAEKKFPTDRTAVQKDKKIWKPAAHHALFEQEEDGRYRVKCNIKTYSDPKTKPNQFHKDGTKCADDFQLTSGSIIHIMVKIAPWNYAGKTGVSIRPKSVKVMELKEWESDDGGDVFADQTVPTEDSDPFATGANDFDDEIPF